ncbi:MAG: PAS domain-containing sensor histidine kinase [Actinobacteria bacterium]|nr:PAS domain-containing sensor histidine kinase [Actinomycetota bacterium]
MTAVQRDAREAARRVVELAGDAVVTVDEAGVIVDWSPQAERTFGWAQEQASGRELASLIVPPEQQERYRRALASICNTAGPTRGGRLQVEARDRDGNILPVEAAVWANGKGDRCTFNVLFHDLCDQRQRYEAMERLAALVEGSQDPIISTTLDGTVLSWNRAAEDLYGFSEDEIVGQSVFLIVPDGGRAEMEDWLDQMARGERVRHHETVRRARSGCTAEVAVAMSPIRDASGSVVAASIVDRDLTESRWIASTLDVTLKTLQEALAEAQTAEARSRVFLADAAHQLRTPLAGIRAAAQSLLLGVDGADRDRLLADLVREASRAGRLIGSLLQIARLDEGEVLAPTPCDLVALCSDEVSRTWSVAPHLDIVVRHEALPQGGLVLDEGAVREILANLLDNARRHAVSRIEVVLIQSQGNVDVRVNDDGPGLPQGAEERVFQRFVSLDGRGGCGLGLAIARELARTHGGDLFYDQRGFTLRLPTDYQAKSH